MSILICGMEMPKKGEYRMTLYVCDDGYAYMDVDLFPVDKDRFEAVPVPPHGDLIDREALMDDIICSTVLSGRKAPKEAAIVQEVLDIVGDAKAIIPASGGQEDE